MTDQPRMKLINLINISYFAGNCNQLRLKENWKQAEFATL